MEPMKFIVNDNVNYMGEKYRSFGMSGKNHTKETKDRMSIAHKNNPTNFWLGKKMSPEFRKKLSESQKGRVAWNKGLRGLNCGEKNPSWKGGVTSINTKIRQSADYKLWRASVFKRDNYTCICCGERTRKGKRIKLNADHIKPFAFYPELRLVLENGRTLCIGCHKKTDTYARKTK